MDDAVLKEIRRTRRTKCGLWRTNWWESESAEVLKVQKLDADDLIQFWHSVQY